MSAALTSLVNFPAHKLVTCVHCGGKRVTVLAMTLTDGSLVDFASCHRCEGKCWSEDGRVLELASVLDRSRKQR
jgi:hypothetical protein